jgi:cyclin-dependent kinase 7
MLYGSKSYGPAADMWAVGCLFAELMQRKPLFPGDGRELGQLGIIFAKLGTPTEEQWPNAKHLPNFTPFAAKKPTPWKAMFPAATPDCLDLLKGLLQFDPNKRLSASEALEHAYFKAEPKATTLLNMPTVEKTKT